MTTTDNTTPPSIANKTLAVWLALVLGPLGIHQFYVRGLGSVWGWLHWPVTLLGAVGLRLVLLEGTDNQAVWVLLPLLGGAVPNGDCVGPKPARAVEPTLQPQRPSQPFGRRHTTAYGVGRGAGAVGGCCGTDFQPGDQLSRLF